MQHPWVLVCEIVVAHITNVHNCDGCEESFIMHRDGRTYSLVMGAPIAMVAC